MGSPELGHGSQYPSLFPSGDHGGVPDWIDLLACPVCREPLSPRAGGAGCPCGHHFDSARSGYLNLTGGRPSGRMGDSAAMARAREAFLAAGYYEPIAETLSAAAPRAAVVAEAGCGTGWYLQRVAAAAGSKIGIGFDLSKPAIDRAARRLPELRFAVADVQERVPLRDGTAGLVLSVFAPRPAAELTRVTAPGATFLAAFANADHLAALSASAGSIGVHPGKLERLTEALAPAFEAAGRATVRRAITLTPDDAAALVAMGPGARHGASVEGLAGPIDDVLSVTVASFRRR